MRLQIMSSFVAVAMSSVLSGVVVAQAQTKAPVTITWWTLTSQQDSKQIVADFEKKYPNIRVKMTTFSTDGVKQAEKVAASSGTLPDVYWDWGGTLASYYQQNGLALDLTPYIHKMGWDKRFSKLAIHLGSYDGKFYEVPVNLNGMDIFYRKDIFKKYHISPPKTFSQLVSDANTLKAHGVTPFGAGGLHHWYTMRFVDALLEHFAGPKLHDNLMSLKANWNNPKVVKTFDELRTWVNAGYFPQGFLSIDETQDAIQFEQGKAAMVLEGPWFDSKLISDKFPVSKAGNFEFPEDQKSNRLSSFVQGYMISSKSSHINEAIKFVNFYTSNQNLKKYKDTLATPFANVHVLPPASQPNAGQIQKDLAKDGGFLVSDQYLPQQLVQDYWQAIDSVVSGSMTPDAAAKFMQQQVTQYKQSYGG